MQSIISIAFIEQKIDEENCNSSEFIKNLKNSKLLILPPFFQDFEKEISSLYKSKSEFKIIGIEPSGKRILINNENYDSHKNKISIYFILNQQDINSNIDIDTDIFDLNINLNINEEKIKKGISGLILTNGEDEKVIEQKERSKVFTRQISQEIEKTHNNLFDSFIGDFESKLNKDLNKSLNDIVLKCSQKNIQKLDDLRKSVKLTSNNIFKKADSCVSIAKQNIKKMKEVQDLLSKEPIIKQSQPIRPATPPKPIDEKIFEFYEELMTIEKTIKDEKFLIEKIKIKNISNKDYNSNNISWFKGDKSDENINFDQDKISKEFPFGNEDIYKSKQDIDNLDLKLSINNPEEKDYKMYISLINKENKKEISVKPLEIIVKMKKGEDENELTKEKIDEILNKLKNEIEYFDFILSEKEEISEKIKEKKRRRKRD